MEVTLEEGKETPHPPQVENQAPPPRVSSLGRSKPYPLPPAPVALTRETRTPRRSAKLLHCVDIAYAEAGILTQEYLSPDWLHSEAAKPT